MTYIKGGSVEEKQYEELMEDLKNFTENVGETQYFAYPFGHYTKEMEQALKDSGYHLAFKFGKGKKARKTDNNFEISRINTSFGMKNWKLAIKMLLPFTY